MGLFVCMIQCLSWSVDYTRQTVHPGCWEYVEQIDIFWVGKSLNPDKPLWISWGKENRMMHFRRSSAEIRSQKSHANRHHVCWNPNLIVLFHAYWPFPHAHAIAPDRMLSLPTWLRLHSDRIRYTRRHSLTNCSRLKCDWYYNAYKTSLGKALS